MGDVFNDDTDAAHIEFDGMAVAQMRNTKDGVEIRTIDFQTRILGMFERVQCGEVMMYADELSHNLAGGEWVSARQARFGTD